MRMKEQSRPQSTVVCWASLAEANDSSGHNPVLKISCFWVASPFTPRSSVRDLVNADHRHMFHTARHYYSYYPLFLATPKVGDRSPQAMTSLRDRVIRDAVNPLAVNGKLPTSPSVGKPVHSDLHRGLQSRRRCSA